MRNIRYNLIFHPEPKGGFTVIVPSLPGCVSYGANIEDAREMARDAIHAYIASLKKHREPVPIPDDRDFLGFVELALPASAYA